MTPTQDQRNIDKAIQSAEFLLSDLQFIVSSKNGFLSDIALGEIEVIAKLKARLERAQNNLTQLGQ